MTSERAKIVAIVGPTASGKSGLAVELAEKYSGEVISADSRQVYERLDIGTDKIRAEETRGIPHHMIDVTDPKNTFTAQQFKSQAEEAIGGILTRGNLPIIAGGTGFYIQALVDNTSLPEAPPNETLRAELAEKSTGELFEELERLDPERAQTIERDNPRRLIRAIEIARAYDGPAPKPHKTAPKYEVLQIGLWPSDETLRAKIEKRNAEMAEGGLTEEVEELRAQGIPDLRLQEFGFEYVLPLEYIKGELTKEELLKKMNEKTWQYAKRQRTWFKRDPRIHWLEDESPKQQVKEASRLVAAFLNN